MTVFPELWFPVGSLLHLSEEVTHLSLHAADVWSLFSATTPRCYQAEDTRPALVCTNVHI